MVSSATGGARERLTTPTDAAWTVSGAARCTAEDCVAAQEGELPPALASASGVRRGRAGAAGLGLAGGQPDGAECGAAGAPVEC
ncbi:hypothetical protein GCM10027030_01060 [Luteococcus sediminum]